MRIVMCLISFAVFLLMLTGYVNADLYMKAITPTNGGYIYGSDSDYFSVEITGSNLNTSNVTLSYKVEGPSTWGKVFLNCTGNQGDWICQGKIPEIESLLADGKRLLYYFEASDEDGEIYDLGDENNPLSVLVDRSAPYIEEMNVEKGFWIGKNYTIIAKIKDKYSGVNEVKFFYGNSEWNSSKENCVEIGENEYRIPWDVSNLEDGSSWNLFIETIDKVGNKNTTIVKGLRIDNEDPKIESTYPKNGDGLFDFVNFDLNVSDAYSGISKAYYYLEYYRSNMSCSNYECQATVNTRNYTDGLHKLTFVVYDNANNTVDVSMNITIDNVNPIISVIQPNSFYVHKVVTFEINVGNVKSIRNAEIKLGGRTYAFSCENNTCTKKIDTTTFPDNEYDATISVENEVGFVVTKKIRIFIDNSNPLTTFSAKCENDTIYIDASAIDDIGLNSNKTTITVVYNNTTEKIKPKCNSFVNGKKLVCSAKMFIGNNKSSDYYVTVTFYDLAGNEVSKSSKVVPSNYTVINIVEKNQTGGNIIVVNKNETSADNYTKKYLTTSLITFAVILAIIVTLFSILIFTKTKRVIKSITFSIEKNISKEISALQLAVNYLIAASSEEDEVVSQTYMMNTSKIINEVYPGNFILFEMNKLPSSVRQSIFEKYGKQLSHLKTKSSEVAKVKSILSDSNMRIKEKASKSIEIVKKIIMIDKKELEIWNKIKKEYLGE